MHAWSSLVAPAPAAALLATVGAAAAKPLPPGPTGWRDSGRNVVRGVTVGPIENALFATKGYGTPSSARSLERARGLGATWVSVTPFGRVFDLHPSGVSHTFETPFRSNRERVALTVRQAHERGLQVLLVPHLWVETGGWRGEIELPDAAAWARWAKAYEGFLLEWARVAAESEVDLLAVGVELRSWVTSPYAGLFVDVIRAVRRVFPGLITYAANWDDVEDTVVLGEVDVIGINAFYPLAERNGAGIDELLNGGRAAMRRAQVVAEMWQKPVMFTEFGYTARHDCGVRPWEWPEHLGATALDEEAQAEAYVALLGPVLDAPWFAGAFVWRVFADPDDLTQEPEWGFSPRGKLSEAVLRQAFAATWAGDASPALLRWR